MEIGRDSPSDCPREIRRRPGGSDSYDGAYRVGTHPLPGMNSRLSEERQPTPTLAAKHNRMAIRRNVRMRRA